MESREWMNFLQRIARAIFSGFDLDINDISLESFCLAE